MNPKQPLLNMECQTHKPKRRSRHSQLGCEIEGCTGKYCAKGLCEKHYTRLRRFDDPVAPLSRAPRGEHLAWIDAHKDYHGDNCVFWPFGKMKHRYRTVKKDGVTRGAHCVMCEHRYGPPPTPKHEVAHSCGNGVEGCVNPNHLSWKTHTENEADKIAHGTLPRGEGHSMVKLTTADVLEIKKAQGVTQQVLADRYGVSQSAISLIKKGKLWKFLEREPLHV